MNLPLRLVDANANWARIPLGFLGLVLAIGLTDDAQAGTLASVHTWAVQTGSNGYVENFEQGTGATSAHAVGGTYDHLSIDGFAFGGAGGLPCGTSFLTPCFSVGAPNGQGTALAEANGAKGTLRASASAHAGPGAPAKGANAGAELRDTVTFNGAKVINIDLDYSRGASGYRSDHSLSFQLGAYFNICGGGEGSGCSMERVDLFSLTVREVNGSLSGDDSSYVLRYYNAEGEFIDQNVDEIPFGSIEFSLDLGFLGQDTFDLYATLSATANAEGFDDPGVHDLGSDAFMLAHETLYLGMADYVSSNGYSYAGRQDTTPDPDPVEVPAPPSLLLLATGLAGLGLTRRRRTGRERGAA